MSLDTQVEQPAVDCHTELIVQLGQRRAGRCMQIAQWLASAK